METVQLPPRAKNPARSNKYEAVQIRYETFKSVFNANGGNATQAAIEAGYSPKSASVIGSQLVKRLRIQEAAEGRSLATLENSLLSEERLTKLLEQMLFHDPRDIHDAEGNLKPIHQWPEAARMALQSFDRDQTTDKRGTPVGVSYKPRFADKLTALEKAMKYRGMFERDNRQKAEAIAISVQFSADPNARDGDSAVDVTPTTTPSTPGPATRGRGRK